MCPPHICEQSHIWRQYQSLMLTCPWRHSESSPDLRWPRVSRSTIVQLPCACDPPSTDAGLSTDAHMKVHSLENRLLQLCAVRLTILHHSEAPANPEQRGAYRSGSASAFSSTFVLAQGVLPLHDPWLWHCRRRCRTVATLLDVQCIYACAFEMCVLMFDFYTLTHASIRR